MEMKTYSEEFSASPSNRNSPFPNQPISDHHNAFATSHLGHTVHQFNKFDDNESQDSDSVSPGPDLNPVSLGSASTYPACPACRRGVLTDQYSRCGIFLGIVLFPCGLICCYLSKEKVCSECKTVFS